MRSWQLRPSGYKNRQGIDNVTGMKTNVDVAKNILTPSSKLAWTSLMQSVKIVLSQLWGTIKLQSLFIYFEDLNASPQEPPEENHRTAGMRKETGS